MAITGVVPTQIRTYGDLKNAVALWMNRDDPEFLDQIGNFINFAEKEVYRNVRMPQFEREIYLPIREGMAYIPADCLEIKYIMKAGTGQTYRVTSIEELDWRRRGVGQHSAFDKDDITFARTTGRLYFYPPITAHVPATSSAPLDGTEVLISYYRDTAEMVSDNESNEVLTLAPELFLYLSLKHACVFVQDDAGAQKWSAMSSQVIEELAMQNRKMEYSGSPLAIPNNFANTTSRYHSLNSISMRF